MATLQAVRGRIRSVAGTRQITKAMQLVAASKLRKYQLSAMGPGLYTEAARELLEHLGGSMVLSLHPLYQVRKVRNVLTIIIAGDHGMAGAYNANVLRQLDENIKKYGVPQLALCVGKHAALHVARTPGVDELAAFELEQDDSDLGLARPLLREAIDLFVAEKVDVVDIVYTRFVSTVRQEVVSERLLPVAPPTGGALETKLEPDPERLIDYATRHILEALLLQAILDAQAGEQASRMLAMMNASDNAKELIGDLTLAYNNARQAAITQQISEISAGAEAMKD
jgi:F-type H+-transporting ATPase subunit gamma